MFRWKRGLADGVAFVCGSALYSLGVMAFITPSEISPGGVTGIAALLSDFVGLSTGFWVLLLNIPLVILGWRQFGGRFIWRTAVVVVLNSVILDLWGKLLPQYRGDRMLAAVFGGIFVGAGLAIVMLRGATTGGIDIAAKIINQRFPHLSMGRLMLMIDAVIVVSAALVYRQAETAMYSAVALFASSFVMDSLLYGADRGKAVLIVTDRPTEIADAIFARARRGVTMVKTVGAYTGHARTMLICAARRSDVSAVLSAVRAHDSRAFIIVAEAGEILGEGFEKRIKEA